MNGVIQRAHSENLHRTRAKDRTTDTTCSPAVAAWSKVVRLATPHTETETLF